MRCPICTFNGHVVMKDVYDDRYGYPGSFALEHCNNCGHIFLDHTLCQNDLGDLYTNYYPRSLYDIDSFKPFVDHLGFFAWLDGSRSSAFRWVPPDVRVLDIGCGFGQSLGFHEARGCDVYGVEADRNILRVAEKYGYKVHVGPFDPDCYESNFFDYVTMDQVIEHVIDPIDILSGVERILKHGGKVILTTPNANGWGAKVFGRKWINWHAPYHMQFFTKDSMQKLSEATGMVVESVQTITPSAWLNIQWMHLLMYPRPGQKSDFWSKLACGKKPVISGSTRFIMRVVKIVNVLKINHLITRLADMVGVGDCLVFVLRKP